MPSSPLNAFLVIVIGAWAVTAITVPLLVLTHGVSAHICVAHIGCWSGHHGTWHTSSTREVPYAMRP